ncbi:MAG: hypothetical protein KGS61_17395 [Verrucomicrobia bacterium]|nr:hypothetical protein [Verrucomicrobiota bacterium]
MNPDDFEQWLGCQPFRAAPPEWRAQILTACKTPDSHSTLHVAHRTFHVSVWRQWLWPCPRAWAGLAAIWALSLALQLVSRSPSAQMAKSSAPAQAESVMSFAEQRQWLAQLLDSPNAVPALEAEPPKAFTPRPHSERRRDSVAV